LPVILPETIVRRRCAALIPYARNARTQTGAYRSWAIMRKQKIFSGASEREVTGNIVKSLNG
jgi:hypothetical protein